MKGVLIIILISFGSPVYSQTFSPYVSRMPLINQMAQVGIYKQRLYDSRTEIIQNNVNIVSKNIELFHIGNHINGDLVLKERPEEPGTYVSNGIIEKFKSKHSGIFRNYLISIANVDFTEDYLFQRIINNLNEINNNAMLDLKPLLK